MQVVTRCASRVTGSLQSVGSRFRNLAAVQQRPRKVQHPYWKFKSTLTDSYLDSMALLLPRESPFFIFRLIYIKGLSRLFTAASADVSERPEAVTPLEPLN